jgi:hypothetical protein
MFVLPWVAWKS